MNLKTTTEAEEEVKAILTQSPHDFEYETSLWSIETIQKTIHWLQECPKAGGVANLETARV